MASFLDMIEKVGVTPEAGVELKEIPLGEIRPDENQVRVTLRENEIEHAEALQELADSIREHGLLEPILVRETEQGYVIVAGERRYRACQLAGLDTIPAIVREFEDEKEILSIQMIENLQRKDLTDYEVCLAVKRLVDAGMKKGEIAKAWGKSPAFVSDRMKELECFDQFPDIAERLSPVGRAAWMRLDDEQRESVLAQAGTEGEISVELLRQAKAKKKLAAKPVSGGDEKEEVGSVADHLPQPKEEYEESEAEAEAEVLAEDLAEDFDEDSEILEPNLDAERGKKYEDWKEHPALAKAKAALEGKDELKEKVLELALTLQSLDRYERQAVVDFIHAVASEQLEPSL